MILHIPHASRELGNYIKLRNEKENLDYLTDTYADELFWGGDRIKFPLSRFVCDVERLEHNEPMEAKGQGIIYRKDVFGNDIERMISDEDVYKMYKEYHKKLNITTNKQLAYHENIVIVDCHTFKSEDDNDPDVCVGADYLHTPKELVNLIENHLQKHGLTTDINYPYEGTIVPSVHTSNYNVKSVMIEINRDAYDENLKNTIETLLEKISDYEWSIA
jgi:N-formylglutamate deformylase